MFIKQLNQQTISPLSNTFLFELANIPLEDQSLLKKLSLRALNMIYTYTNGRVVTETNFEIYIDLADVALAQRLPVRPIFDIASVSVFNIDNEETTLLDTSYHFVQGDSAIFFKTFPSDVRSERTFKITMSAGYDAQNTPLDLIGAVEQLTIFLYENRGDSMTTEIPLSIRMLLDPYVIHRL